MIIYKIPIVWNTNIDKRSYTHLRLGSIPHQFKEFLYLHPVFIKIILI
jgi:hypothetical protein